MTCPDKVCTCIDREDVKEHVANFGDAVTTSILMNFVGACPDLFKRAVVQATVRMLHMQVQHAEKTADIPRNLMADGELLFSLIEEASKALAKDVVEAAAMAQAMSEKEESKHGSH
jgi:hypothetical protein